VNEGIQNFRGKTGGSSEKGETKLGEKSSLKGRKGLWEKVQRRKSDKKLLGGGKFVVEFGWKERKGGESEFAGKRKEEENKENTILGIRPSRPRKW